MAAAQGRGSAFAAITIGFLLALQCYRWHASAKTWTVGDSQGWKLGVNYTNWTSGKTFKTEDILFFPYSQGQHNVVVVDKSGYDSCSSTDQLMNYTDGNTNVTLNAMGTQYYLCSFPSHCSPGGMKLAVTVTAAGGAGSSPSTAPPPATAPAHLGSAPSLATLLGLAATVLAF